MYLDNTPAISIGMPILNAGGYLRQAIFSIKQQTFSRWELIIIDDASTDGAVDSIRELHDPRIRIVHGSDNRGLATRLNEAVALARGKYFARMDQDDVSHPDRLERQLRFLESHPEIDVVGSRCLLIDGESQPSGVLQFPTDHEQICRRPWRSILLPHPTWMGKVKWFRRNPYRSPGPYRCEDQELLLRTHRTARFAALPESLLAYRVKGPVPTAKLFRTRATLAFFQFRHCLGHGEPLNALKAIVLFMAKCVHDWVVPSTGRPAKSAHAGVQLANITEHDRARWQLVLPELPAHGAKSAQANRR